jgi:hypothetical protein
MDAKERAETRQPLGRAEHPSPLSPPLPLPLPSFPGQGRAPPPPFPSPLPLISFPGQDEIEWMQERFETRQPLGRTEHRQVVEQLLRAELLEKTLADKYPASKRRVRADARLVAPTAGGGGAGGRVSCLI